MVSDPSRALADQFAIWFYFCFVNSQQHHVDCESLCRFCYYRIRYIPKQSLSWALLLGNSTSPTSKLDTLEYSLYLMAGNIFGVVCTLDFYLLQIWRLPFSLEYWLVLAYALILIVPIWGCIGLADNNNFGFKGSHSFYSVGPCFSCSSWRCARSQKRWEFYVQKFIFNLSDSTVNPRPLLGVGAERKRDRVVRVASDIVVRSST